MQAVFVVPPLRRKSHNVITTLQTCFMLKVIEEGKAWRGRGGSAGVNEGTSGGWTGDGRRAGEGRGGGEWHPADIEKVSLGGGKGPAMAVLPFRWPVSIPSSAFRCCHSKLKTQHGTSTVGDTRLSRAESSRVESNRAEAERTETWP